MGLRIVYGRAGSGKSEYCFSEIANLIEKEKIYVITPEQFSFTAEKKLMDAIEENAVFNAEVITFKRMAYRILNEVGGAVNTTLSKCGRAMLVYSILNSQRRNLKFLGKSDENIDLSLAVITELKKHGINQNMLKQEIENTDDMYLKTKLQDISIIYESFENKIADNYIDETDLLSKLVDKIDKTEMFKNSLIYTDEFAGFTNQEYEVISKILKLAKQVTITACVDDINVSNTPDTDIFYSNKITVSKLEQLTENNEEISRVNLDEIKRFKAEELNHLEKNLYATTYKKYNEKVENISLFLAKNQYSEIENVAKSILKLVRDKNYRYNEISVITKNMESYSSLIRAIFAKYEIPVFIDERRDLNQNIVVQYVLSIIEVFNKNWSNEAVFNYIKTGFVGIDTEEIFELENYCTKWGIKQNKWKQDFEYGITDETETTKVKRLNEIRNQIVNPLNELRINMYKEKTAENISKVLYNFLQEQNFEEKLQQKIEYLEEQGLIDIANEYKESYKIIIQILDEMVMIFKEEQLSVDTYINLLRIGLKNSGLGKIPGTADQVIVGDVERSRSHKVKAIFIIGLNDGVFPSINKEEGFLNDSDRAILKEHGLELAKGTLENLYDDNFNIYKAFTTAEEKLHLSYALSDADAKSLRPSILVSKIKKIFPKLKEDSDIIKTKDEILTKSTTYEELINNIHKLNCGENINELWYDVYNIYKNDLEWNDNLKQALKGILYTNMPEKISQENIDKLYGNTLNTSVSKLEQYRRCPFSYYLQYGLRLKEKEEFKIQNINTGTFMHEVIDEFFSNLGEQTELNTITDEEIAEIVNNIINEKLKLNKNYIFTSSNRYKLLVARLRRILVKAIKYIIETLNKSEFNILGTEVEFGENKEYAPIIINLGNNKKVEITGKIDRIDIARNKEGSYLRIIDYKSSAKNIDLNEVYAGLQIQLLTYLDAVCRIEDLMPAGILYFSLLEQMVKADRKMTEEEIEEKIRANFRMKGLILADVKVVKMHDKTLSSGASKIVPVYIDKSGNLGSKTNGVTKEEFADLEKYMYKTIKEISEEILNGRIDLKPYYKKGNTPCKYCQYKEICGFNAGFSNNCYNYIGSDTKEEVLEKIRNKNIC